MFQIFHVQSSETVAMIYLRMCRAKLEMGRLCALTLVFEARRIPIGSYVRDRNGLGLASSG